MPGKQVARRGEGEPTDDEPQAGSGPRASGSPGTSTRRSRDGGTVFQAAGRQVVDGEVLPPTD